MTPRDMRSIRAAAILCGLSAILLAGGAAADEGMWTFDRLPLKQLQEHYGFTPTPQWIEHVQKSCVRFGGASGSFVSPDGLVLTNHHVAFDQLQKMSTAQVDYIRDGFYARDRNAEIPCPDLELKVLQSIEEVTDKVLGAIDPNAPEEEQSAQRRAAIARIEQESTEATGLKSEVVELYRGGAYSLYRYKTYTDVRLVAAPEAQIAFFGGDYDNFTYPRHDLDFTFFRIYENGAPVHSTDYLRWSPIGPLENELVFVAGHPGSTSRLKTVAQLEYERDYEIPIRLKIQTQRVKTYNEYAAMGAEEARQAADRIKGIENTLKRLRGFQEVLNAPGFLDERKRHEEDLKKRVAADPRLAPTSGAWDQIEAAQKELITRHKEILYRDISRVSRLVDVACGIVRYTAEVEKPNEKRLSEFRGPSLDSQRFRLFSRAPVYPQMEQFLLTVTLGQIKDELGPDDSFVKAALGGHPADEVARRLLSGTKLADVSVRKELIKGGRAAVEASQDPLIVWAREIDAPYRELRRWQEDRVETKVSLAGNKIARDLFALEGDSVYPDATGTLRLSYGRAAGYEQGTTLVPWKTTFYGLYDRSASFGGRFPFNLPPRFDEHRNDLNMAMPLNFVTTDDIVGGNSGSPVLNQKGDLVGLIFDGNIPAFAWDYTYTDLQARAVAVHSSAIIEALRKLYGMDGLANELEAAARQ